MPQRRPLRRGDLVYVLNAENGGAVQGYQMFFGHLLPIPDANRSLGLDPTATPQFTHTPGQVAFSPGGSHLIVTTKANGNDIDVFGIGAGGGLSAHPVVNSEPGTIPFGIVPGSATSSSPRPASTRWRPIPSTRTGP